MTNSEEYEKALNDSFNAYHNLPKDTCGQIPAGYSMAFNYGYTFGMQQATAEQRENSERQLNFRREQIATAAIQGLLSAATIERVFTMKGTTEFIVQEAVRCADALIDELNKKKDERTD